MNKKLTYDGATNLLVDQIAAIPVGTENIVFSCNTDLRGDFFDLLKSVKEQHFVILETNGRRFSYEAYCKNACVIVDKFAVFINGDCPEVHESITRTPGSYAQTLRGIYNLVRHGAVVQANVVVIKQNMMSLNSIVKILQEMGVNEIRFVYPILREDNADVPSIREVYPHIDSAKTIASGLGMTIHTGEIMYNPFIPTDLDLDGSTVRLAYETIDCNNEKLVSVVIPTYNRKDLLKNTLNSIFRQSFPASEYEIIVIDDGSTDNTLAMVKHLQPPCHLKVYYWPRNTPYIFGYAGNRAGPARNLGAKFAKGRILLFLDSDIACDVDFLSKHFEAHQKHRKAVVFGLRKGLPRLSNNLGVVPQEIDFNNIDTAEDDFVSKHFLELCDRLQLQGKGLSDCAFPWLFFMSHNISILRNEFIPFDDNFIFYGMEDQEWLFRLYHNGFLVYPDKGIIVLHQWHKPEFISEDNRDAIYRQNQQIVYSKHLDSSFMHFMIFLKNYLFIADKDKLSSILRNYQIRYDFPELVKRSTEENALVNVQESNAGITGVTSYPTRLYMELTRNCNLRCKMCMRTVLPDIGEQKMPIELFKKIADELFPYAQFIDLRGLGESLLLPDVQQYIDYALRFNCNIGLLTNLTIENDGLLKYLIQNKLWIGISIDGPDIHTYGKIRDGAYFNQLMHNIKVLRDTAGDNYPSELYFLVVVQRDNLGVLPEFIVLAKSLGISKIEFKPVMSKDRKICLKGEEQRVRSSIIQSLELAKSLGVTLILTGSFLDEQTNQALGLGLIQKCTRPWTHAYITYNGFVGPCNHQFQMVFGSLKYWPFDEVWNNRNLQLFRSIVNTPCRPERCDECFKTYFNNEWS